MSENIFVGICPDLGSLEDGTLIYHLPSTVHLPGDYVVADCDYHFPVKGPKIRKCQSMEDGVDMMQDVEMVIK